MNKQVAEERFDDDTEPHNISKPKRSVMQNPMETLAARVSSKLEEGDYRGAVRLASSQEKFAEHSDATTAALRLKHPLRRADFVIEVQPQYSQPSFTADVDMVRRAIMSFPSGSGGGTDGLLPQHLKDLIGPASQEGAMALLNALTSLVNLILEGRTPPLIHCILFGAKLSALTKEKGGVRPIAVGGTIRRLASKCACQHALTSIPNILAPHQLGFGVPGGIEAAVHATRIYLSSLPNDKAILKVDFENAFNSVRREKVFDAVKKFIPNLFPYVHSAYATESILWWDETQIISSEGIQQGDPIGPLLFCLIIQGLVSDLKSECKVFYLDDGTLGGSLQVLSKDLKYIEEEGWKLGLHLNVSKSEVIASDQSVVGNLLSEFPGLRFTHPSKATLLGSPLGMDAMAPILQSQIESLQLIGDRMHHLHAHDSLTLLHHSFSIPKLLHVLRTSPAFKSPLLGTWDHMLRSIVSKITNINFQPNAPSWLQATLPVYAGGLGIRRASHLASTTFLGSADGAHSLMLDLLPVHLSAAPYAEQDWALLAWQNDLPPHTPVPATPSKQKVWDGPKVDAVFEMLVEECNDDQNRARLLGSRTPESGAWLNPRVRCMVEC